MTEINTPGEIENLKQELEIWSDLTIKDIFGILGFVHIYDYLYLGVITKIRNVGNIIPGQDIYFIEKVKFYPISVSINYFLIQLLLVQI